jgi:nucleoside-diphosphate-sugar epimerase
MRFDLAINGMVLGVYKNKKIPVMRDGTQWRPFVHVKDTSKAFVTVLESPENKVNKEIFNIGSNEQNVQILPLAELVMKTLDVTPQVEWYGSLDKRSYRVSFDKIRNTLGFVPDYTPKEGATEVYEALESKRVTDSLRTKTVEWYKHLLEANKLLEEVTLRGTVL